MLGEDNRVSEAEMRSVNVFDLEASLEAKPLKQEVKEGLLIDFEDLSYTVQEKKKDKGILSGVSGMFSPGKMTALMGPSGSGKTTLLDVVAGRKTAGRITGSVLFNGRRATASILKQQVGYVEQFDTLVPELTVQQMLMYAAELKLPESVSTDEKKRKVQQVIDQLSLDVCRDTVIGDALRKGISGGQAKRVNIGLALITSPSVIFLDEPTTGLDSHMANEVVLILRKLAREGGRTICATIHSPTSFAFNLFDELLMLKDGRVIYDGPLANDAAHARDFFAAQGFVPPSAESGIYFSSVEWLVEVTSGRSSSVLAGSGSAGSAKAEGGSSDNGNGNGNEVDFASAYAASPLLQSNQQRRAQERRVHGMGMGMGMGVGGSGGKEGAAVGAMGDVGGDGRDSGREVATSSLHGIATLLRYRTMTHVRSPDFLGPRFGDKVMFSVLILSLYWKIGESTDAQGIQSTASLLYFIIALCGYGAAAFVPSLTLDRPLFYRERADGYYSTFTYYVAKFLEEAIVASLTSLGSFGIFLAVYFLTSMIGIVLAYAVAAAVPTMEAANALLPTYVTFCMYFGGLFLIFEKIPKGWQMVNQFGGDSQQGGGQQAVFGGKDVLAFYSISTEGGVMDDIGFCCAMLVVLMVVFATLGGLALSKFKHVSR